MTASVLMVSVLIATLFSKQWAVFTTFAFVKDFGDLTEEDIHRGSKMRVLDELR